MTSTATDHMTNQAHLKYFGKAFTEGTPTGILDLIGSYAVHVPYYDSTMYAISENSPHLGRYGASRSVRKTVKYINKTIKKDSTDESHFYSLSALYRRDEEDSDDDSDSD